MSKTARQAERIDGRRVVDWDINGVPILEGRELPLPRYDNRERQCCGSLVTGPHKMGCILQAHERVALPATRDAGGVVTVCQRACRCGPDMCADSVACPRGVA